MGNIAVNAQGLSKLYRIGVVQKNYDRLSDQLFDFLGAPIRRARKLLQGEITGAAELDAEIWALKDLDLNIDHGEIVGIIGRNGAGKSTLLKILSRITAPTEGFADVYGRLGSLLEVGTGFHPELTGRENIFLNGAILGMGRAEIRSKFDAIVDFAEIEEFIDTPAKHYSSGMYVRLAFSVAAHLEPEILLVDEVLAVGDVAFQRKCLGKMDEVGSEGRTVLFVSHNMSIMQTLCQRGMLLEHGKIVADGPISDVIDTYLKSLDEKAVLDVAERTDRRGKGDVRLINYDVRDKNDLSTRVLKTGQPAKLSFQVNKLIPRIGCNFFLYDHFGHPVAVFKSRQQGPLDTYGDDNQFVCEIPELLLLPGRYRMDVVIIGDHLMQDSVEAVAFIDVGEGAVGGRPAPPDKKFRLTIPHRWVVPERYA